MNAVAAILGVVNGAGNRTPRAVSHALVSTPSTEPTITAAAHAITRRGTAAASSINAISATMNQLSASVKTPQERQQQTVRAGNQTGDHRPDM